MGREENKKEYAKTENGIRSNLGLYGTNYDLLGNNL